MKLGHIWKDPWRSISTKKKEREEISHIMVKWNSTALCNINHITQFWKDLNKKTHSFSYMKTKVTFIIIGIIVIAPLIVVLSVNKDESSENLNQIKFWKSKNVNVSNQTDKDKSQKTFKDKVISSLQQTLIIIVKIQVKNTMVL